MDLSTLESYFPVCYLSVSYLFYLKKMLSGVLLSFPSQKNKLNLTLFFNFPGHSSTKMYRRWNFPLSPSTSLRDEPFFEECLTPDSRREIYDGASHVWLHGGRQRSPVRCTWPRACTALRAQALLCYYLVLEIYGRPLHLSGPQELQRLVSIMSVALSCSIILQSHNYLSHIILQMPHDVQSQSYHCPGVTGWDILGG